ncbi:MAG: gliding motility-associated protein GldE [Marinifilaceae bacterium]
MEADLYRPEILSGVFVGSFEVMDIIYILIFIILLICSGLISGSEVAYFSLTPSQISRIKERGFERIINLLKRPNRLLATILISNNFVNVAIVVLSTYIVNTQFNFEGHKILGTIIQVVVVTFVILLFGEIIPKLYANRAQIKVAQFMVTPLHVLEALFRPLSWLLIKSSSVLRDKMARKDELSIDQLSKALELTNDLEINEEKDILEGIVRFSNINASDIIQPRINVVALEHDDSFKEVKKVVLENSYSRMPVYAENLDTITGILYIKDLLPHLHETDHFSWQHLTRPAYFVPESKKINDLLEEFRAKKVHLAVVVDEYGGTSGIVTMEDILEEIIGEINDEYDEKETNYTRTQNGDYIFQASILLNDFEKIIDLDSQAFRDIEGEADTLAGLILEIVGELPKRGDIITYKHYKFTILDVDSRRIKKIKFETMEGPSQLDN